MKNLNIKLATGKIVTLESFNISTTYGGMLVGNPSKEDNIELVNNISYPKDWGTRKAVFNKSDLYISDDVLKPLVFSAWLSAEAINDKENQFDGSHIIVIWLGDTIKGKTLDELIVLGLENFDWNKHAENFLI
jgi:hypothetical protein